ncbi:MAG: DUF92 domain-containing protein [Candidatus Diapherotrites archaeon]|nr:DUF92 domain-containing protein [Candidatus Diapherotrites archaeon]
MANELELAIVLVVLGIVSFWSYKKKFLDNEGLLIAFILGLSVFILGGIAGFTTLVIFFGVAELGTIFFTGKNVKQKHALRGTGNILGNALAGIVALLFNSPIGFFCAISASLADTLSSEIGILSKQKPRLITTFKQVDRGVDGGISLLGLGAAIVGAMVMGGVYFGFFHNAKIALVVFAAGFFGSVADSILGATIQKKGLVDNNEVNFLASAIAAIAGAIGTLLI